MRKTKIVCTIGPACSDEAILKEMCLAGMNVARLNFSHGTHEEHQKRIDLIKKVREELSLPIAIMLDTKGPEYRIKTFENGRITLKEGDDFCFTTQDVIGNQSRVSVNDEEIAKELKVGDSILLNNGLLAFQVVACSDTDIQCKVVVGGDLSDRKSMSFPNRVFSREYLSEQDRSDILFGIQNDVDFIACSFVSNKQDLLKVRALLDSVSAQGIDLIAKIENRSGVDNIIEICEACDGIMIARGDMGVEIPFEELPAIQKELITTCRLLGKRVITATEMLESMINSIRPTRAEISDVANAVYDGTSAIMLSGETAAGRYPVKAVETMSRIALQTEKSIHYSKRYHATEFKIKNIVDAISHAACGMAIDINAEVIAVCSRSGMTVRMVSRFRPTADVLGLTTNVKTWRQLNLSWGVLPMLLEEYESTEVLFHMAKQLAKQAFPLKSGDRILLMGGLTNGISGNTNLLKVEVV